MPSAKPGFDDDSSELDEKIRALQVKITVQQITLAALKAEGHEVADATAHLSNLRDELAALLPIRNKS
jgi:hypothetical protein